MEQVKQNHIDAQTRLKNLGESECHYKHHLQGFIVNLQKFRKEKL